MKNQKIHTIPLEALLASCICVAKHDVREYLSYIKVQDGYVGSTDGHRLFRCDIEGLDTELDLFIPPQIIKSLSLGLVGKNRKGDVEITVKKCDDESIVIMKFANRTEKFVNDNFGKFPNLRDEKVVPTDGKITNEMIWVNWDYMVDFKKIAKILGVFPNPLLKSTGKTNPALVKFDGYENAIGVVMPMKE